MVDFRVVDTNVLIVASAADDGSRFRPENTPVEEAALRERVLLWLQNFETDPERYVVLDYDWNICGEYQKKLTNQDYGWLAIMRKQDMGQVEWVDVQIDDGGHGILEPHHATAVTDLEDRKMVAAALAVLTMEKKCELTVACDTDWIDCEDHLLTHGLKIEHLLEDWLRAKWQSMGKR